MDLDITVSEKATGNLLAGAGYSSSEGLILSGSISQNNVFGSGNSLTAAINTSKVNRNIALSYVEPYWTPDGVSRTMEIYDRNVDPSSLPISEYSSSTYGAAIGFGVPITETDTINFGGRYEHTKLTLFDQSPPAYVEFVRQFGFVTNSWIASAGWSRDSRDNILFPNSGYVQSLAGEIGLPLGDLQYYKVNYLGQLFIPMPSSFVGMLRAELGYGGGMQGKTLPFFKAYYAGGVGSVRGYESSSLGPQDIFGNVIGGRRKIIGNAELFFPLPGAKLDQSVRLSVFADAARSITMAISRISNPSGIRSAQALRGIHRWDR